LIATWRTTALADPISETGLGTAGRGVRGAQSIIFNSKHSTFDSNHSHFVLGIGG
jgi:hypothetical protein